MTVDDFIAHYGIKRRSGRYPWGSGDRPYQGETKRNGSLTKEELADIKKVIKTLKPTDYSDFDEDINDKKHVQYANISYENKNPVAFVLSRKLREHYDDVDRNVSVISIAVSPEHRGKGLAKKLANEAISVAKNDDETSAIYWGAVKTNDSSIKLAKSLGFEFDYSSGDYVIYSMDSKSSKHSEEVKEMTADDFIAHFGIKRRSGRYPWGSGERPYQGESKSFRRARTPEDEEKDRRKNMVKRKNLRNMSMDDLKNEIERMRQEKTLKELVEDDLAPGRRAIKKAAAEIGMQTLKQWVKGGMDYGINLALTDGKFDAKDLASAVYPNLNKKKNESSGT